MRHEDGWFYNGERGRFKLEVFIAGEWYAWKGDRIPPREMPGPGPKVGRTIDAVDAARVEGSPLTPVMVRVHPANVAEYEAAIPTKDQWRFWVIADEAEIP